MILQQIYSGNYTANVTKIARVCIRYYKTTFWSLFSGHSVHFESCEVPRFVLGRFTLLTAGVNKRQRREATCFRSTVRLSVRPLSSFIVRRSVALLTPIWRATISLLTSIGEISVKLGTTVLYVSAHFWPFKVRGQMLKSWRGQENFTRDAISVTLRTKWRDFNDTFKVKCLRPRS